MRPIDADYLKAGFEEDGHLSPYIKRYIDACPTTESVYDQLRESLCGNKNASLEECLEAVSQLKKAAECIPNRVLTLEEIDEYPWDEYKSIPLWVETLGGNVHDEETGEEYEEPCEVFASVVCIFDEDDYAAFFNAKNGEKNIIGNLVLLLEYGKTWRCWLRKPTDEERVAVKWE